MSAGRHLAAILD